MRIPLSLATVLALGSAASAQAPIPAGPAPKFGFATASEKDGTVTIEIFELRETMRMKIPNAGDVFIEKRNWLPWTKGALGKDIRAYRPDGKSATADEVLKALSRGRGVAYFVGFDNNRAVQPDLFYLGLLKEGSVALAFDRPALAEPVP